MKKFATALIAVAAVSAAAAPAFAQPYGTYGHGGSRNIAREIEQLDTRVDRAYARRTISRREHNRLEGMVTQLRYQYRAYMRDGRLSRAENNDLQNRIQRVEYALRSERRDGDGRRH